MRRNFSADLGGAGRQRCSREFVGTAASSGCGGDDRDSADSFESYSRGFGVVLTEQFADHGGVEGLPITNHDESFPALDELTAHELRADFVELCETASASSVMVTHSIENAFTIAHWAIVRAKPAKVIADYDVEAERASERSLDDTRREMRDLIGTGNLLQHLGAQVRS